MTNSKLLDGIFGAGKKVEELPMTKAEQRVAAKKKAREERLGLKKRRSEIKKLNAERRKKIKKFWKDGYDPDPTFAIWGAGKLSHPELWKNIMDDLISKGCSIKTGGNNLTYGASATRGKAGVLSITEDASILLYNMKRNIF